MRRLAWLLILILGCSGGGGESPTAPPPPQSASLSGRVVTVGTTNAVTGVIVKAQGKSHTTGNDGTYSLTGLMTGSATVTAERSGYENYSRTITLTAGGNTHDISLSQSTSGTSVSGSVRGLFPIGGSTVPISGATVTMAGKTDTTDAAGNFQLPTIPEGNQTVTVTAPGWQTYSQSFFVSSTNRTLTIDLQYGLPDLRGKLGVEWTACSHPACTRSTTSTVYVARVRPTTTVSATEAWVVSATYDYRLTENGQPLHTGSLLRRANTGSCSVACNELPTASASGELHRTSAGTVVTQFDRWLGARGPVTSPDPPDGLWVAWTSPSNGCAMTAQCPSGSSCGVEIIVQGTLRVAAANDTGTYSHYEIPFGGSTPWTNMTNSTFCR